MIYEVRANLFFNKEDEAKDFYHDCEKALAKSIIVNPNDENVEFATIDLIHNYHDEEPNQPCIIVASDSTKPLN